ncbi:MAG: TIGR02594 family protein [Candidatus Lernaella stagnicola]|nr:TIGR02594 family protein [Candidatus Lernaella stagnicola]
MKTNWWLKFAAWLGRMYGMATCPKRRITPPLPSPKRARPPVALRPEALLAKTEPAVPAWYGVALAELGQAEIAGPDHNPRIQEYLASSGLMYVADETAWCAAFVNWCLQQAGLEGTERPNARSFLAYGEPADTPRVGDIVVLWRIAPDHWTGHSAFYAGEENGDLLLLGGNQGDCVTVARYSKDRVLDIRRPPAA